MTRTICIYHANCADGFTAAWAVRQALGSGVEFVPAGYGDEPPDVDDADVVIVDFSYPRAVLERMAKWARSILVLDHHKTAQAELAALPQAQTTWHQHKRCGVRLAAEFDMARSGAQMAWDFFGQRVRPFLIDVVADRDLWKWQIDQSREINAVIGRNQLGRLDQNNEKRKSKNWYN